MSAAPSAAAEAAVLATLARVTGAWNAGDATAYGAEFTPDATYVTFDGHVLVGRDAIVDVHRWLFDGPLKGSTMGATSTGGDSPTVRFLRPDVAHVLTAGAVRPAELVETTPDRDSVPSFVLVDDGDGWRVTAFHNTRRQAVAR
ncbi:SgcJ/EcaC family oxidoreductase [Pseudonocardia lacus]|uniref:SgcJ/EcaC family oxidoreductase n=1 Tax=Pseudonocardia lacus TaxID=2835865 RepID=UPI001BDCB935|nr:SgcJ/EcaC family oxidoreductase [Pseudonocardia lacus]